MTKDSISRRGCMIHGFAPAKKNLLGRRLLGGNAQSPRRLDEVAKSFMRWLCVRVFVLAWRVASKK